MRHVSWSTVFTLSSLFSGFLVSLLLPLSATAATSFIDAKINGSNGPLGVPAGTVTYLSWTSQNVKNCQMAAHANGMLIQASSSVPTTASNIATPPINASLTYSFACQKTSGGGSVFDTVNVYPVADPNAFGSSTPVTIIGYSGSEMEPFISPDGQYLFFNDSTSSKQLYWASRIDDTDFTFLGALGGSVNATSSAQETPSIDMNGNYFFTSNRTYAHDLNTLFEGSFASSTGMVDPITSVSGISRHILNWIDMDESISPDGQTLYYTEAYVTGNPIPNQTNMAQAIQTGTSTFSELANSSTIMANVNDNHYLNYAPDISSDGLEFFFTRLATSTNDAQLYRATRTSTTTAFTNLQLINAATGFVEGPSLAPDGKNLYYHKQIGPNAYQIFLVTRP